MKKLLITGAEGFVGHYLIEQLKNKYNILATYFLEKDFEVQSVYLDISDLESLNKYVTDYRPDIICHLAAQSSGGVSYNNPYQTYSINVLGTANILECIRTASNNIRLFIPSSSDVYGIPNYLPIDEKHPLNPTNPYSSSKMIAEQITMQYVMHYDLDAVLSRSFNHTGIGQDEKFFVPTVIRKIRNAKDGDTITMGNIAIMRDFLDVRDMVRAYELLLESAPGIYNVAANDPTVLNDIVEFVIKLSGKHINIKIDPDKVRKNENLRLFGTFEKLKKETGWEPKISINETLEWMYKNYE